MRAHQNTITISEEADIIIAGRRVESRLEGIEFDDKTIQEVVLVVHELASNIVKHAGEGTIELALDSDIIEIRASDSGPGIDDIDQAVVDGFSTVGSLGGGLGTVHRLMDNVSIRTNGMVTSGVEIMATRGNSAQPAETQVPPIEIAAATRPQPGYDKSGDAFLVKHGEHSTLISVIDGLGHGPAAHRAASAARQYLETHSTKQLSDLFAGVEEACRSTRGVVMLLARFEWDDHEMSVGSVGNITAKVCGSDDPPHLIPVRGVVGGRAPSPRIDRWALHPPFTMVIHTDGVSSEWDCNDIEWRDKRAGVSAADRLLREYSKPNDDATVLVIRGTQQ